MKTSNFIKYTISPLVLVLALGLTARADGTAANGALPVAPPDQQQEAPPQPPFAEDAAAPAPPAEATTPDTEMKEGQAAGAPGQFDQQAPTAEAAPPTEQSEMPAPAEAVRHHSHVKTAKEQLAFDKKTLKDTKAKIAKILQQERQGDKDMKKAKAAIKTAEASLTAAKKKKSKIEASLHGYEKTRIALEKTLKKTTVLVAKDTKRTGGRVPASARR